VGAAVRPSVHWLQLRRWLRAVRGDGEGGVSADGRIRDVRKPVGVFLTCYECGLPLAGIPIETHPDCVALRGDKGLRYDVEVLNSEDW
jgi:hypothetical protein